MPITPEPTRVARHFKRWIGGSPIGLTLYGLGTGPVAWATNDDYHIPYLPDDVWLLYNPLSPLLRVEWIHSAFFFYTVILWEGFPAGYTTL